MLLHFQPKIHPYWLVVQVSIYFPWDPEIPFPLAFCCRSSLSPTVTGPPCHQSFLPLIFNSCPATLVQYLGILFPLLKVHRIFFVNCSTTFFFDLQTSLSNLISILHLIFLFLTSDLLLSNQNISPS